MKRNSVCFVCEGDLEKDKFQINNEVNLPACVPCSGTDEERKKVKELLESLAEGFVCGCI